MVVADNLGTNSFILELKDSLMSGDLRSGSLIQLRLRNDSLWGIERYESIDTT